MPQIGDTRKCGGRLEIIRSITNLYTAPTIVYKCICCDEEYLKPKGNYYCDKWLYYLEILVGGLGAHSSYQGRLCKGWFRTSHGDDGKKWGSPVIE